MRRDRRRFAVSCRIFRRTATYCNSECLGVSDPVAHRCIGVPLVLPLLHAQTGWRTEKYRKAQAANSHRWALRTQLQRRQERVRRARESRTRAPPRRCRTLGGGELGGGSLSGEPVYSTSTSTRSHQCVYREQCGDVVHASRRYMDLVRSSPYATAGHVPKTFWLRDNICFGSMRSGTLL